MSIVNKQSIISNKGLDGRSVEPKAGAFARGSSLLFIDYYLLSRAFSAGGEA